MKERITSDLFDEHTNCGNLCEHNTAKGICETARFRVGRLASGRRKRIKQERKQKAKEYRERKKKGNVRKIAVRKYYLCVPAVRLFDGNLSFANATN